MEGHKRLAIPLDPTLKEILDLEPQQPDLPPHGAWPSVLRRCFGNWWADRRRHVSVGDKRVDGRRKAAAWRPAEVGCTAHQIISQGPFVDEGGRALHPAAVQIRLAQAAISEITSTTVSNRLKV